TTVGCSNGSRAPPYGSTTALPEPSMRGSRPSSRGATPSWSRRQTSGTSSAARSRLCSRGHYRTRRGGSHPMRRRELLLGAPALMTTRAARAQQKAMPVIGYLGGASPAPFAPFVAAFRQGMSEAGYVEGQNVAIEYHWAEGHYDRLPAMAADLVVRKV